jgi:methyl-accepting chemotaxis protein
MNLSIRLRLVAAGAIQLLVLLLVAAFGYSNLQQLRHADASHEHSTSVQNRLQVMQRGLGELILTEGSSASRQLTLEAVKASSQSCSCWRRPPPRPTALGQTVRDVIVPQWQAIRASVEKGRGAQAPVLGRTSTPCRPLASSPPTALPWPNPWSRVVASAQASGEAAMDRLVVFASVGALVLMGVLVVSSLALLHHPAAAAAGDKHRGPCGGRRDYGVVNADHQREVAQVLQALGSMRSQLSTVVNRVREGADGVATSSAEIALGNLDLSNREQAASKLQHTAASIVQLTQAVGHSAHAAAQASQLAQAAQGVAHRGGAAMTDVVSTWTDQCRLAAHCRHRRRH